jgi:exosortase/archaeosortase family protein
MPKLTTALKSVLLKFLLFAVLFIVASGITGSWVVSNNLLYGFNFFIYGNLGKMVLISIIVFGLLIRKRLKNLEDLPKPKTDTSLLILSFLFIPTFFLFGNSLLKFNSFSTNIPLSLLTHGILILIPSLLLLGVFGFKFLISFVKQFSKEILICLGIAIVYDVAIFQVWKLWPIFSDGVLQSVHFLLSLTSSSVKVVEPRIIIVNNFAVSIEQACSGLDSLFLFSSLYLLIALLDFKEFNKIKLVIMAIPAVIGLYLVNILRVYLLIIIGAYISRDLSTKLFHTYLGMVLFIIFFFVFWKLFYSWMKKPVRQAQGKLNQ